MVGECEEAGTLARGRSTDLSWKDRKREVGDSFLGKGKQGEDENESTFVIELVGWRAQFLKPVR